MRVGPSICLPSATPLFIDVHELIETSLLGKLLLEHVLSVSDYVIAQYKCMPCRVPISALTGVRIDVFRVLLSYQLLQERALMSSVFCSRIS